MTPDTPHTGQLPTEKSRPDLGAGSLSPSAQPGGGEALISGAAAHAHLDLAAAHSVSYGKLAAVWVALLVLTACTVLVTRYELGAWKVWAALGIACLKAALVIAIFMHMKYESRLLRGFLLLALVTLAIFIGFTFFDVLYR